MGQVVLSFQLSTINSQLIFSFLLFNHFVLMRKFSHTCARYLSHVCDKSLTRVRELAHKDLKRVYVSTKRFICLDEKTDS
jgi:hypothetical protein